VQSTVGGNSPQMLLNDAAATISRGELDVAVICGAEAVYTRMLTRRTHEHLEWTNQPADTPAPRVMGVDRPGNHDAETMRSIMLPTQVYPIFENALRHAAGETFDQHQQKIAGLWSRFSEVAAANPYAWSPEAKTADEIGTPSADNRMIGFPYPKLMNANIQTDQAAGLIICSVEAARAAGVPQERWVFPLAGADAHDHWFVSERQNLHSSPAIAACAREVFGLAGFGPDDVAHADVYSCFPSAVQIGAAAVGLGLDRQLTVTGGLTFAGGPGNNYVTHSIASMVDALRADPGSLGLVTALGWYVTKHSVGLYSTEPPTQGFRNASAQAEVDALPRRAIITEHDGSVTIESFTVMHERDGSPALTIAACLTPDGGRTWANSNESDIAKALMTDDLIGTGATVQSGGTLQL
jgi:acetyl-CoA C-acetyltransferase